MRVRAGWLSFLLLGSGCAGVLELDSLSFGDCPGTSCAGGAGGVPDVASTAGGGARDAETNGGESPGADPPETNVGGGGTSADSDVGGSGAQPGVTTGNGGAGESGGCPTELEGPRLLEIPRPGGGIYCIDRTEVTSADYERFLADTPSSESQGAECTWNESFGPELGVECDHLVYDPVVQPKVPVTCVDWCDAKMYCEWAGKELCGAIDGGPVAPTDFADAALDAWYSACSRDGEREFPYGDEYEGLSCAGLDYPASSPVSVATLPNCVGGYQGLFDMSGNVSEWENACESSDGASDQCVHRGGAILDADEPSTTLRCNSAGAGDAPEPALRARNTRHRHIGFRCCYVP